MNRVGNPGWWAWIQREWVQFDRACWWFWPIALVLVVAFALVGLTVWAGATAWLWTTLR